MDEFVESTTPTFGIIKYFQIHRFSTLRIQVKLRQLKYISFHTNIINNLYSSSKCSVYSQSWKTNYNMKCVKLSYQFFLVLRLFPLRCLNTYLISLLVLTLKNTRNFCKVHQWWLNFMNIQNVCRFFSNFLFNSLL